MTVMTALMMTVTGDDVAAFGAGAHPPHPLNGLEYLWAGAEICKRRHARPKKACAAHDKANAARPAKTKGRPRCMLTVRTRGHGQSLEHRVEVEGRLHSLEFNQEPHITSATPHKRAARACLGL